MIDEEGKRILQVLSPFVNKQLDGKETVKYMRDTGSKNWKQMEWVGFFIEEECRKILIENIGGKKGSSYGRTGFDYENENTWDIKAHSIKDKHGAEIKDCILNDKSAMESVLDKDGYVGAIIFLCDVEHDSTGEFKEWHDNLKGKKSKYVEKGIATNRPSRSRKKSCFIKGIIILKITKEDLVNGIDEKWIESFQEGMINSNGHYRREKIAISINDIPERCIICRC